MNCGVKRSKRNCHPERSRGICTSLNQQQMLKGSPLYPLSSSAVGVRNQSVILSEARRRAIDSKAPYRGVEEPRPCDLADALLTFRREARHQNAHHFLLGMPNRSS